MVCDYGLLVGYLLLLSFWVLLFFLTMLSSSTSTSASSNLYFPDFIFYTCFPLLASSSTHFYSLSGTLLLSDYPSFSPDFKESFTLYFFILYTLQAIYAVVTSKNRVVTAMNAPTAETTEVVL